MDSIEGGLLRAPHVADLSPQRASDGWKRAMTPWAWGSQLVVWLYEALYAQGAVLCVVAVIAGLRSTVWGLRLTDCCGESFLAFEDRPRRTLFWLTHAQSRSGQVIGCLLQIGGTVLTAIAMVALARVLAGG